MPKKINRELETSMPSSATVLANFICRSDAGTIPAGARAHGRRAFLNWIGCAFGAATHPAVDALLGSLEDMGTLRDTMVIGRGRQADMQHAALINAMTSSILAFDDTHIHTVTHPTGPVAAALLAYAEHHRVSGADFLSALVLGIEIECRLSNALSKPPAECSVGWYLTGVTGAAGAAAALGKVMGLDEEAMTRAIALGALQGAGFRQAHGSMCLGFVPGHAARAGVLAAHMARRGFTCSNQIFEGKNGFFDVFAQRPDPEALTRDLGATYQVEQNLCKPYPAGIFIHAAIDACLKVRREHAFSPDDIQAARLVVHPLGVGLTGRVAPQDTIEALVSIYHWAAVVLLTGRAGIKEVSDASVRDPRVIALRDLVTAIPDPALARDEARLVVTLRDGRELEAHVPHAWGGPDHPLDDEDVAAKFADQAEMIVSKQKAGEIAALCFGLETVADMRTLIALLA
ncbi:MmgE/PrpD family protein [Roseixanthobacter liquoris]|uniref:MmgE/PrpD family protein n=1 Tax=Roseixanthobacter liquoris TaxID=3119921 RepID=UPI00372CBD7D